MHARFFIVDRPHIGLFRNNIVKQRSLISGLGRQMLTTLALYPKCNKKRQMTRFILHLRQ
jgi:hypothetical protein